MIRSILDFIGWLMFALRRSRSARFAAQRLRRAAADPVRAHRQAEKCTLGGRCKQRARGALREAAAGSRAHTLRSAWLA